MGGWGRHDGTDRTFFPVIGDILPHFIFVLRSGGHAVGIAVTAGTGVGRISARHTGGRGDNRGIAVGVLAGELRDAFCFFIRADCAGDGQNSVFLGAGRFGDYARTKAMRRFAQPDRTAHAADIPVLELIRFRADGVLDTVTSDGAIVGFPLCAFGTDAVPAAEAFRIGGAAVIAPSAIRADGFAGLALAAAGADRRAVGAGLSALGADIGAIAAVAAELAHTARAVLTASAVEA